MDTQQNTALTRALAELPGPLPARGVIHIAIRHTDRFTVVGNDLAQHPGLSTAAVGFAVRIQSLPQGTDVGIKALAARFPEGEKRIATALRELEAHGYLQRTRTRLPNGRIITRTVFCNRPAALLRPRTAPAAPLPRPTPPPASQPRPTPVAPPPLPPHAPAPEALPAEPAPVPAPVQQAPAPDPASEIPLPGSVPEAPAAVPGRPAAFETRVPPPTAPKPPRPQLPQPRELTPELARTAAALLCDLRNHAPEFILSAAQVQQLTPGVAAWLERDAHPDTVRHLLTNNPPQPVRYPAHLVKHRLTALLPPPLPDARELAPPRRSPVTPFQTCDGCERAFRSAAPGHCRDCRTATADLRAAA
ncbi:hypothetical protein ACIRRX_04850 [Streptomyces bacillaris]